MIRENELRVVGKLLKPHGICGEITALLTEDVDLSALSCIILRIDGIFVPFFLDGVRPKSSETDLLSIDGITDEMQASALCPNDIYALKSEFPECADEDAEGFYASDFKGYGINANGGFLGKITGIDDTTANYLFIVERPSGETCLIPVAGEFVTGIDVAGKTVDMELPEGLIDINES